MRWMDRERESGVYRANVRKSTEQMKLIGMMDYQVIFHLLDT